MAFNIPLATCFLVLGTQSAVITVVHSVLHRNKRNEAETLPTDTLFSEDRHYAFSKHFLKVSHLWLNTLKSLILCILQTC